MYREQNIQTQNDIQFREIALRVLEQAGFEAYSPEEKTSQPPAQMDIMKKGEHLYCVETVYSRREEYTSRAILAAAESLIDLAKNMRCLPLIVVGGILPSSLQAEILGISFRTVVLDIRNLIYIAKSDSENHELYDELVARLPYFPDGLAPREPEYLPIPDWNAAYAGKDDWEISVAAFQPDFSDTVVPPPAPPLDRNGEKLLIGDEWVEVDFGTLNPNGAQKPGGLQPDSNFRVLGRPGTGKSSSAAANAFLFLQSEAKQLKKDVQNWKGGKETSSASYEKLCTRTLMRLFAEDLTLWREQAKSNEALFRFDLICKIKRDNHKDFWEMAERYFGSKYIIFEFKNYSGRVTQKEVYTTVRYLYTKAMRGVAILISPNGMDTNAGKAIRGVLRDEGKLILSLTNEDLIHMLQMKEYGEDPADYLSDKLDELLIDLEK